MNAKLLISVTHANASVTNTTVESGATIDPALFGDVSAIAILVVQIAGEQATPAWSIVSQRSGL